MQGSWSNIKFVTAWWTKVITLFELFIMWISVWHLSDDVITYALFSSIQLEMVCKDKMCWTIHAIVALQFFTIKVTSTWLLFHLSIKVWAFISKIWSKMKGEEYMCFTWQWILGKEVPTRPLLFWVQCEVFDKWLLSKKYLNESMATLWILFEHNSLVTFPFS